MDGADEVSARVRGNVEAAFIIKVGAVEEPVVNDSAGKWGKPGGQSANKVQSRGIKGHVFLDAVHDAGIKAADEDVCREECNVSVVIRSIDVISTGKCVGGGELGSRDVDEEEVEVF